MFMKNGGRILVCALITALLSGCGGTLSKQKDAGSASPEITAGEEEAAGNPETEATDENPAGSEITAGDEETTGNPETEATDENPAGSEITTGDEEANYPETKAADENPADSNITTKDEELSGNPETEAADENPADHTSKAAAGNSGRRKTSDTSHSKMQETPAAQPEISGSEAAAGTIYEGLYFDESFYQYVDMPPEESPLIYCEIVISNVTDTSFDFTVHEKVMATGESAVLITSSTAVIEEPGSKAVYKGDDLTLTFSFPDDQNTFPQHLEISGLEQLENNVYINNTIPGHESG